MQHWTNYFLEGWIRQLENSAEYQRRRLAETPEVDGQVEDFYGIDGFTWNLDGLFVEYFPDLQRAAAFLLVWAALEKHMDELCEEIAVVGHYERTLQDMKGTGLSRARTCLLKVADLEGEWAHPKWEEIGRLRKIRNRFAHRYGQIEKRHVDEEAYAHASPHLTLDNGKIIHIEISFLPFVIRQHREFLLALRQVVVMRFASLLGK